MPVVPEDTPPATPAAPKRVARLQKAGKVYGLVSDILTPQRLGLLAAVAVLLGFGWLGGWNEAVAETDEIAVAKVGQAHAATPFEITVKKAFHADKVSPILPTVAGRRYLMVTADVVNTSGRPVLAGTLTSDVTLDAEGLATLERRDGPAVARPQVFRINDTLSARAFSPGVTVPVVLVWEQDATAKIPSQVTITVPKHAWRASSMDGSEDWRDPEPEFRVILDVAELPEG